MHLVLVADTRPVGHKKFREWLESYTFKTGGHPQVSEIRLYDIRIKESDQKEILESLIYNESGGHWGIGKISMMGKLLRQFLPIKSLDNEKRAARKAVKRLAKQPRKKGNPRHFKDHWLYVHIIGRVDDEYDRFGVEGL